MQYRSMFFRLSVIILLLISPFEPTLALDWNDNCREQSGGGAGLWFGDCPAYDNSETNWQFNSFPGPSDNAFIGAEYGMVIVDGYASVMAVDAQGGLEISYASHSLTLSSGSSSINGLVQISGSITAHDGVLLNLLGNSYLGGYFYGPGEVVNLGTASLDYGKFRDGAKIVNQGTANLTSGYCLLSGGDTEFVNEGGFDIGGTSTDIRGSDSLFRNNGTISIHQPGSTFSIGSDFISAGTIMVSSGTLHLSSRYSALSGEVTVQSGSTLILNSSSSSSESHSLSGLIGGLGLVENNDVYDVNEDLTLAVGTGDPESGSGGFLHTGDLRIAGIYASVQNVGRFRFNNGRVVEGVGLGSFVNNPSGWVYTRSSGGGEIGCDFENNGSFQLGGGSISLYLGIEFNNSGMVNIKGGGIGGEGRFYNSGMFSVNLGNPSAISNINTLFRPQPGGTVQVFTGNLRFNGEIPNLTIEEQTLYWGTWIAHEGTSITFPITVKILGPAVRLSGKDTSFPNVDLEKILEGSEFSTEEWETLGDLFNEGGNLEAQAGGNGLHVNGTLTNSEGGTVGIESGAQLDTDHMQNGGGEDSVMSELASIVIIAKALGEPATIITPLLDNHGRIAPGERGSISTLHQIGNLVQHPTGVLDIDLNGAVADSLHDQLTIDGNATLDGLVKVRLKSGFWPTVGQEFIIMTTTGTIAGTFAGVDSPLGASFSLRHEPNQVVLVTEEVFGPSPVPELSTEFQLAAAYPNPFNPSTTLGFDLPRELPVSLRIYDVSGRLVRELLRGRIEPAGHGQVTWDGRDDRGGLVPAGVYFYRLEAGQYIATKRMTLVK